MFVQPISLDIMFCIQLAIRDLVKITDGASDFQMITSVGVDLVTEAEIANIVSTWKISRIHSLSSSVNPPLLIIELNLCYVSGDPHYRTFDGEMIHFQGMCTYNLATPLQQYPGLEHFSILTRNERRNGGTTVSYPRYVEVKVYGKTIRMERNKVITVSNRQEI